MKWTVLALWFLTSLIGSTAKFIFEDHPASFQGNIHFEDDLIGRNLRERGRRRIQDAVPAVLDAALSNQPCLPDPVPAVPGLFKVAPKSVVVGNSLEVKATLPPLNSLALDAGHGQDGRFKIGQAFDSVRRKPNSLVRSNQRDLASGLLVRSNLNGLARSKAGGGLLVSYPNGAVVPQDEPEVAAARAKILALLAEETNIAQQGQTNTNPTYGPDYRLPVHHNHQGLGLQQAGGPPRYKGELNLNVELVSHPNGALVPADEPAVVVVAARANHLAAPGHTLLKDALFAALNGHSVKHQQDPGLVKHPNGAIVPVESQDVRAARAAHLAHHQRH